MEPRLKNSKKWTPLPDELVEQVESLFAENFSGFSENGRFFFEGQIFPQELLLRLGYLPQNKIKQNNFEVSLEYQSSKENLMSLIHLAVDACASLFTDWTEDEENKPPAEWQEFKFQSKSIYARYSTINTQLETEANRLLGEDHSDLVMDDEDIENQLQQKISILGLDEED
ncbi:MAG: hypothetical protein KDD58_11715 [Bdellovibrionales bacterium]|nr:hypothetical protein [Bdellovibrionales bacterium]